MNRITDNNTLNEMAIVNRELTIKGEADATINDRDKPEFLNTFCKVYPNFADRVELTDNKLVLV